MTQLALVLSFFCNELCGSEMFLLRDLLYVDLVYLLGQIVQTYITASYQMPLQNCYLCGIVMTHSFLDNCFWTSCKVMSLTSILFWFYIQ